MKKIQRILILLISLLVTWGLYSFVSCRIRAAVKISYNDVKKVFNGKKR